MSDRERVRIVVEDTPGQPGTFNSRLKRLLKGMLRGYGLRCVSVTDAPPEPADDDERKREEQRT